MHFRDKKIHRDSRAFLNRAGNKERCERMIISGRNVAVLASRDPGRSQGDIALGNK